MREIYIQYYTSPCGELILASIGNELCLCDWNGMSCAERNKRRISKYLNVEFRTGSSSVIEKTNTQLDDYFAGKRKGFNIPLCPFGTDFQLQVWKSLLDIPFEVFLLCLSFSVTSDFGSCSISVLALQI